LLGAAVYKRTAGAILGNLAAARYEVHFYKVCNLRRAPDAIHLLSLDTHALAHSLGGGGAGLNNAHTTGGALLVNTPVRVCVASALGDPCK
jgi:hypothetical protein